MRTLTIILNIIEIIIFIVIAGALAEVETENGAGGKAIVIMFVINVVMTYMIDIFMLVRG